MHFDMVERPESRRGVEEERRKNHNRFGGEGGDRLCLREDRSREINGTLGREPRTSQLLQYEVRKSKKKSTQVYFPRGDTH